MQFIKQCFGDSVFYLDEKGGLIGFLDSDKIPHFQKGALPKERELLIEQWKKEGIDVSSLEKG